MAIEDKYINPDLVADTPLITDPLQAGGANLVSFSSNFEVAAADSNGSVFRVLKGISANLVPLSLELSHDAQTTGTGYVIGLYKTDLGLVVDKDILMATTSLATATKKVNALAAVDVANEDKTLWELAGYTVKTKPSTFDLCVTADVIGTSGGTISLKGIFAQN